MIQMCVLSFLVGCATNKYASSCVGWFPIYLEKQDVKSISSNLAREILKHNKQGEKVCGWNHGQKKIKKNKRAHGNRKRNAARNATYLSRYENDVSRYEVDSIFHFSTDS